MSDDYATVTVRRSDLRDALDLIDWRPEPVPAFLDRLMAATQEAER